MLAWVLIWIGRLVYFFTIDNTPRSETSTASTLVSSSFFKNSGSLSSSSFLGITFTVQYNFLPRLWANSAPSFISSKEKFLAAALKLKASPPKYTASAPYLKAIFNFSKFPAGAKSSGFLYLGFI